MPQTCRSALLAACVLTAACDGPDRVTATPAPRAPNAPSADVSLPPPIGIAPGYVLTDISGGVRSSATDIDVHGWVVGSRGAAGHEHGFIRHADGTVEDIPPLPGDVSTVATGINDDGQVVGTSTAPNGSTRAWFKAPLDAIRVLWDAQCNGDTDANAIDNEGAIAGRCAHMPTYWPTYHDFPSVVYNAPGSTTDVGGIEPVGYVVQPNGTRVAIADGHYGVVFPPMPSGTTSSWITGTNGSHAIVGGYTIGGVDRGFFAPSLGSAVQRLLHVAYGISGQGRMVGWYVSIPAVAYTIAPNEIAETPLPPTNLDRAAVRVNHCGSIVGWYFPSGLQGGPRAALWKKPTCD